MPKSAPNSVSRRSSRLAGQSPIVSETKKDMVTSGNPSIVKTKATATAPTTSKAPSSRTLKQGDVLPSMILQDNEGVDVDVGQLTKEMGLVLFLYPRADTPGCTNQACGFRDIHQEIINLGYQVYGLSKDKPQAQQKWIDKKNLNYKLLCDPESKLIKLLGAFVPPNNTKRSHFIFEKGGKLVDIQLGVKPADDPGNCLKFIKK